MVRYLVTKNCIDMIHAERREKQKHFGCDTIKTVSFDKLSNFLYRDSTGELRLPRLRGRMALSKARFNYSMNLSKPIHNNDWKRVGKFSVCKIRKGLFYPITILKTHYKDHSETQTFYAGSKKVDSGSIKIREVKFCNWASNSTDFVKDVRKMLCKNPYLDDIAAKTVIFTENA